jgi:hypothetical protein
MHWFLRKRLQFQKSQKTIGSIKTAVYQVIVLFGQNSPIRASWPITFVSLTLPNMLLIILPVALILISALLYQRRVTETTPVQK